MILTAFSYELHRFSEKSLIFSSLSYLLSRLLNEPIQRHVVLKISEKMISVNSVITLALCCCKNHMCLYNSAGWVNMTWPELNQSLPESTQQTYAWCPYLQTHIDMLYGHCRQAICFHQESLWWRSNSVEMPPSSIASFPERIHEIRESHRNVIASLTSRH